MNIHDYVYMACTYLICISIEFSIFPTEIFQLFKQLLHFDIHILLKINNCKYTRATYSTKI